MLVYLRCHVLSSRLEKLTKRSIARDIQLKLHKFMINSITKGSWRENLNCRRKMGDYNGKNAATNWKLSLIYGFYCLWWRRIFLFIFFVVVGLSGAVHYRGLFVLHWVFSFNSAYNFWWIFLCKLIGAIFMFFLFCCCCFFCFKGFCSIFGIHT